MPSDPGFDIRPLTVADVAAFRMVRLEMLRLHSDAYGSTLAQWAAMPDDAYAARIADGV